VSENRLVPWDFTRGGDTSEPANIAARGAQVPAHQRPETVTQAMMQSVPGGVTETSLEELEKLGDVLAWAVDGLSHTLRYILEATVIERRTLRSFTYDEVYGWDHPEAGQSIPKTTVARLRDEALAQLRELLAGDAVVQAHIDH
jgi:hypothetical protein